MNYILFLQILAWSGLVWGLVQLLRSITTWHRFECTEAGRLTAILMAAKGERIIGYYFPSRIITIVVCIALLVSIN